MIAPAPRSETIARADRHDVEPLRPVAFTRNRVACLESQIAESCVDAFEVVVGESFEEGEFTEDPEPKRRGTRVGFDFLTATTGCRVCVKPHEQHTHATPKEAVVELGLTRRIARSKLAIDN